MHSWLQIIKKWEKKSIWQWRYGTFLSQCWLMNNCHVYYALVCKFRINALLCSYGMICLPWHPLRAFQCQAKIKLSTADYFSTRQLCLCHRPGSNTSEAQKRDSLICSSSSNKRCGSITLIWTYQQASPRANCTTIYTIILSMVPLSIFTLSNFLLWFGQATAA